MALPLSFAKDGFLPADKLRKRPRVMIVSDGDDNTGKTEFILSAPGPGIVLCLDRGYDAMLDNPNPPPTRRDDFAFKVFQAPKATQHSASQQGIAAYGAVWSSFYGAFRAALDNTDARTVAIDGDADSWELQRLAEHGKLTGVYPETKFTDVYAARRVMINRAWDSGKIIISTNRVGNEYRVIRDKDGHVVMDEKNQPKKEKTGEKTRQGYPDANYLYQVQIRHLFAPSSYNQTLKKQIPMRWGLRILKCKANMELVGTELWGAECNFASLVELIYPQYSLADWGY